MTYTNEQSNAVVAKLAAVKKATDNIKQAIINDEPVALEDAKVLESAGCWMRRRVVAK